VVLAQEQDKNPEGYSLLSMAEEIRALPILMNSDDAIAARGREKTKINTPSV
jgi:hypothetical protein